ncbi:phosphate ABC transporter ATP-binding protein [Nostoc sp. CENA67]|uniref:Phosphate ABC transporter ATP-binding protein n=1 Tax=Amazonocrinis nigriterrae CENA67 TaxID=2794033 RepID=A0A8J7HRA4_9NOST|nr:phosphate ABC transporter ATP-binding protein PstB [Amazonocrinis nigriterrae]MBH8564506.1 phosphate ABC transporter ATP-binding protein [Amazonocrinis nigriterrae CENA67]
MAAPSLPSVNAYSADSEVILHAQIEAFYYEKFMALRNVDLPIYKNLITTFIGPSGCGKSTLLKCFNRLNDLIPQTRLQGQILFKGRNVYHPLEDAVVLRRNIGMLFQKPNPFPKSIYNNVAFGPRIQGYRGDIDEIVELSLRRAVLWDEVKHKLKENALSLSGGQQQRLCIARMLAVQPEIILMDEPCSALDPISTNQIEALIQELKQHHTIVIVTHNMQQALRVSDMTAFLNTEMKEGSRTGELVEYDRTHIIFHQPKQEITRQYVNGNFG